jgi:hypothetical protein
MGRPASRWPAVAAGTLHDEESAVLMKIEKSPETFQRDLYGTKDLVRLVRPRSIAIVGASPTPGSFGYRTIQNAQLGYTGAIYPVKSEVRHDPWPYLLSEH